MSEDQLQRLRSRLGRRRAMLDQAKRENRANLSETETAEFRALTDEINELEERIGELEDEGDRSLRAADWHRKVGAALGFPSIGETIYGPESRSSYFKDLVAVSRGGDWDAQQRINLYAREVRDLSRVDGAGGAFVPPAWLMGDTAEFPRPGRVLANLFTRRPLPPGTDVINIPRVVTGTATAMQPADNDPVQEVDMTESSLSAPVRTIAGQQDIAMQLLDQSPIDFDELIMRDLVADLDRQLGTQLLSGTGGAGQLLGLRNVTGTNAVTFTDASPTLAALYRRIADSISRVSGSLYRSPNVIVMHPRRWAWALSQNDTTNRPLIVHTTSGPMNAPGIVNGLSDGPVGTLAGLPVYLDSNIPTNLGAGLNEDLVFVLDTSELLLYEGPVRTRILPEPLSGTLTVRAQAWQYVATATRQAKAVAVISGTGLTAPTFS